MIRRNTWIVLGVFLVLLVVMVIMQRQPDDEPELLSTPVVSQTLLSITREDIQRLRIEDAAGEAVEFEIGLDGNWAFVEPVTPAEETESDDISSAVSQTANLRVISNIENPPSLEAMGLDDPAFTIVLTVENEEIFIYVGDETQIENGYYVKLDDESVVVVAKFALDSVLDLLREPPLVPTPTPDLTTETPEVEEIKTESPVDESNIEPTQE